MKDTTYKQVRFTRDNLMDLIICHSKAKEGGQETFKYQGNEYYVPYAKYLIDYLIGKFNEKDDTRIS